MAARRGRFPQHSMWTLASLAGAILLVIAACGEVAGPPPGGDDDPDPDVPAVTSIVVSAEKTTVSLGATAEVSADVTCVAGASSDVSWTSSDPTSLSVEVAPDDCHRATVRGLAIADDVVITATSDFDDTVTGTVVMDVVPEGLSLTNVRSEILPESFVRLTWDVYGATALDVYATGEGVDDVLISGGLPGSAEEATFAIPDSDHQTIRVVASDGSTEVAAEWILRDVVTTVEDYDPYDALGWTPGPEATRIAGSLRDVLARATSGATIGFASDVTRVDLFGVDLDAPVDAHLILDKDVTISGPAYDLATGQPLAIERVEHPAVGDADPLTFRSRMIYVAEGVTVTLENLRITGGAFIFDGGGIRNLGTLTLNRVEVSGNEAWDRGGGILNDGGTLTLVESIVRDNVAATRPADVDTTYYIRGVTGDPDFAVDVTDGGYGGGLFNLRTDGIVGTVEASDSTLTANEAKYVGGSVYNEGEAALTDCEITLSYADPARFGATGHNAGGGIYTDGALSVVRGAVSSNEAGYYGGGLYLLASGTADLVDVAFEHDYADWGGGIYYQTYASDAGANLTRSGLSFFDNWADTADQGDDIYEAVIDDPVAPALAPSRVAPDVTGLRGRDR